MLVLVPGDTETGAELLLSTSDLFVNCFIRVISCEEGKALAESWNAAFMESSAKENQVGGGDAVGQAPASFLRS